MSEYGSVIGGAIGAVIGYFAGGNVYAGWMIGSAIGGAWSASKQVIPGPKIGEAQKQWVTEGAPIPIVYGYSPPMQGTVAADMSEPLVVRTEEDGKGGPKQETEAAYRTYAIVFCEGETELRQAWKNGRLVYNADDPGMAADNAAFLEYATWLPGTFDQMPHPALEELYGPGNTPAFRGRSVLVLDKEDVTDSRGMRSQWHVRVFRGAAKSYTTPPYPAIFRDVASIGFNAPSGSLELVTAYGGAADDAAITFAPTGGSLSDGSEELLVDAVDIALSPTGGTLKDIHVGSAPDDVDVAFVPTGGTLQPSPIGSTASASNITFAPTGGSLSEP